jgi:eukaryotic-like serine/threonine-protein kinase
MNVSSVILISFFTSVLTSASTLYISSRLMPEQTVVKEVVVPNVTGLSEADARANLRAAGLILMVAGREPAADADPETVIKQSLPAGSKIEEDSPISVTLAAPLPEVPDVMGKSVAEASQILENAGYGVQVGDPTPSDSVEEGLVAIQLPKGGAGLQKKKSVTIQPSGGPAEAEVPAVTGLSLATAKEHLQKAGMKLGRVNWVELAERSSYLVVRQEPKGGDKVAPGTEVNLTVNRGD